MLQVKQQSLCWAECCLDKGMDLSFGMNVSAICWSQNLVLLNAKPTLACWGQVDSNVCWCCTWTMSCASATKTTWSVSCCLPWKPSTRSLVKRLRTREMSWPSWRGGTCFYLRTSWLCKAIQSTWNVCLTWCTSTETSSPKKRQAILCWMNQMVVQSLDPVMRAHTGLAWECYYTLQLTMLSANIQFEVCLNVWPNQLSEPLHVCGICVCICLDALTTASCFRTRPTMGYCTTMSWTTPWRCIQTAIGLSTKPQGEVFHQDVCFCLATFFTPLPGVRKLWHWVRLKPRFTLLQVLAAMECWCSTAFHLQSARNLRCAFNFVLTIQLLEHSFAAQAWDASGISAWEFCGFRQRWKNSFYMLDELAHMTILQTYIGTKRLTRERMLYLMYLCKIYDLSSSSFVGSDAAETVKQKEVMKQGVKVFTKHGSSPQESKRLMRILLLSALSLPESMAMEFNVSTSSSASVSSMFWWQLLCMVLMTALCIALGWIFYLKWQINALQGKCSKLSIDTTLYKVLDLLKGYKDKMLGKHENGEEENQESDPIVENPDSIRDVHTMVSGDDPQTIQLMHDTNAVLRARYDRLEALYEEAEIVQDEDAMYTLQNQMDEVLHLMYDIWVFSDRIHALLLYDISWMSHGFKPKLWKQHRSNDHVEAGWTKFTHTYMCQYIHVLAVSLVLHSIAIETFGSLAVHVQRHILWGVSWSSKISTIRRNVQLPILYHLGWCWKGGYSWSTVGE